MRRVVSGEQCACLERKILPELAEILDLRLNLRLAPVLHLLVRCKHKRALLTFAFCVVGGGGGRFR